jgi:hypothetical protein
VILSNHCASFIDTATALSLRNISNADHLTEVCPRCHGAVVILNGFDRVSSANFQLSRKRHNRPSRGDSSRRGQMLCTSFAGAPRSAPLERDHAAAPSQEGLFCMSAVIELTDRRPPVDLQQCDLPVFFRSAS